MTEQTPYNHPDHTPDGQEQVKELQALLLAQTEMIKQLVAQHNQTRIKLQRLLESSKQISSKSQM